MYNKEDVVAVCIKAGAAVDKENNNAVTPLMAAARDGFTAIVKMLLEAGSDAYQVDEFGRTVRAPLKPAQRPLPRSERWCARRRCRRHLWQKRRGSRRPRSW